MRRVLHRGVIGIDSADDFCTVVTAGHRLFRSSLIVMSCMCYLPLRARPQKPPPSDA